MRLAATFALFALCSVHSAQCTVHPALIPSMRSIVIITGTVEHIYAIIHIILNCLYKCYDSLYNQVVSVLTAMLR